VQIAAFRSWRRAFPDAAILLFGDVDSWREEMDRLGIEAAAPLLKGDEGGEVIREMFIDAAKRAADDIFLYVNSDILLDDSAARVVEKLRPRPGPWLASARRCCLAEWVGPALENEMDWQKFYQRAREEGVWGEACAMDMFLFCKVSFQTMPPFLIGHRGWDNWMIYHARSQNIPVIDISADMRVIHCEHDYSYAKGSRDARQRPQKRENFNLHLLGGEAKLFHLGHATHELRSGTLFRRSGWSMWQRSIELWCIMNPEYDWWVKILRRLLHPAIKKMEKITTRHEDWQRNKSRLTRSQ
jgi:hypothetical protein